MRPHLSPFESSKWIVIHAKETKIQFNEMCLCVLNLVWLLLNDEAVTIKNEIQD